MTKFIISLAMIMLFLPASAGAADITESQIEREITAYIKSHAPAGVEMVKWTFRHSSPLPLEGKIAGFELPSPARWKASTAIRMKIAAAGREQPVWLALQLAYSRDVVVASHNLVSGQHIARPDIKVEFRSGWKYLEGSYLEMEDVLGKGIKRPVSKGTCIKKHHINYGTDMKRGDAVVILAEKGSLRVEAPGKVLETGSPGEMIRVLNTLSGKKVYATVLDNNTVAVSF